MVPARQWGINDNHEGFRAREHEDYRPQREVVLFGVHDSGGVALTFACLEPCIYFSPKEHFAPRAERYRLGVAFLFDEDC